MEYLHCQKYVCLLYNIRSVSNTLSGLSTSYEIPNKQKLHAKFFIYYQYGYTRFALCSDKLDLKTNVTLIT